MVRRRAPRRAPVSSGSGSGWFVWLLVLVLAGGLGWLWWRAAYPAARELTFGDDDEEVPFEVPVPAPSPVERRQPGRSPVIPAVPPSSNPPVAEVLAVATNPPVFVPPTVPAVPGPTSAPPVRVPTMAMAVPKNLDMKDVVAAQLALARRGISSGPVDGVIGSQTRAAIRIFQRAEGLPTTGVFDTATWERLRDGTETLTTYTVTAEDLARLTPVPSTWLGKSTRERLDYESVLELVAEKNHAHPKLIRQLNPQVDWYRVRVGTVVTVPASALPPLRGRAGFVRISLSEKALRVYDPRSNLVAHFPCSIARKVEKRPVGELRVTRLATNPNYRFDPQIFRESPEARRIGRKLMIPPGPNNPVGTAWIGLSRPGYGIHGTPHPEDVGRTESHGCFRLANWNAEFLLKAAWIGMPVHVEP